MTLAVFSTSLQEAGDLLSCSWGFPENKAMQSDAQQHQKKSHMSCLKDLCARLQGCVDKMCVWGGLQGWFFPNCMAQNIYTSCTAWHLVCFIHQCLLNTTSGFRCPTCLIVTSFLSLALMMETWMLSDVGGPALMFISPNIWVRYLVARCRCMCPD